MRAIVFLCLLSLTSLAYGEIKSEPVVYEIDGGSFQGWLAYDDNAVGKQPGIVVFPEWWGANDYVKSRARMLAELGYVAFVADMYGEGRTTDDAKEAQSLAGAVYARPELMLERARSALRILQESGKADNGRLAAVGYCMGGTVALNLARSGADLKAVVGFHCGLQNLLKQPSAVKAKVLVLNGADDKTITDEQERAFEDEMREAGADWMYVLFGGAMHAFTNPDADRHKELGVVAYNQNADRRSWRIMRQFLAETLDHTPAAAAERGVAAPR